MRPNIRSILVYLFLISPLLLWGQSPLLRKANSLFDRGEYFAALQLYNQMVTEDIELDTPTKIKTAHCYYNLNNIDKAFEIFTEFEAELTGLDLFTYASVAQKFGFYSGAIDLYRKVRPQMAGKQGHIDEMIKACEWAEQNQSFSSIYLVNPLDITTHGQSFGIQFYNKGIVYSSAADNEDSKAIDKQGMNFLSLYYSDFSEGQVIR
jgi:pentatricopeptide repeat protein